MTEKTGIATFGAGCFWGVEAAFRGIAGVVDARVGYMGGHREHPTYEEVCGGNTGHAEVVQVRFNRDVISYRDLLHHFWNMHDPTTPNRQGPDVGGQYRSVVFTHGREQSRIASEVLGEIESGGVFDAPVVTRIEPATEFWSAEEYHQRYYEKQGHPSYRLL